jgi:LPS-assembly lipoprotein
MITRRAGLIGLTAALGGCGFHPLYAPMAHGGLVGVELGSIYVAVMSERTGQLLRQALQRRFEIAGGGIAKRYELTGGLGVSGEAIAIQQDSSSTHSRLVGTANWNLHMLDLTQTPLTTGTARAVDGVDVSDQEYFAVEMESGTAFRRIAETCADQITLAVASFLRKRAEAART